MSFWVTVGQQLEVALTQALGDAVGLGQGWTWQQAQVGRSFLKGDDSVPTEGWAGTGSSPLRETQGAGGSVVVCILLLRETLLPSSELMLPLQPLIWEKKPQFTHCPSNASYKCVLDHPHHAQLAQCRKHWAKNASKSGLQQFSEVTLMVPPDGFDSLNNHSCFHEQTGLEEIGLETRSSSIPFGSQTMRSAFSHCLFT